MLAEAELEKTVFLARMAERAGLTLVITVVALIIMVAFWRTLSKLDFQLSNSSLTVGSGTVIATPVLVLLALIGLAWVSFSNPIAIEVSEEALAHTPGAEDRPAARDVILRGITNLQAEGNTLSDAEVAEVMGLINCAVAQAPDLAPEDVADLKFRVMAGNWNAEVWGDPAQFREFLLAGPERAALPVNSQARTVFNSENFAC